jgi:hypothetical protein
VGLRSQSKTGLNVGAIERQTGGLRMPGGCTVRSVALADGRGPGVGVDFPVLGRGSEELWAKIIGLRPR